jgi:hypothetical protein
MTDKYEDMDPVALLEEVRKLDQRINNPITDDFLQGVRIEAAHQVCRWGTAHDRGKTPLDWFWLVGYLAQKAATSALRADESLARGDDGPEIRRHLEKALHHTISTAAALLNWHAQLKGRPLSDLARESGIPKFHVPEANRSDERNDAIVFESVSRVPWTGTN